MKLNEFKESLHQTMIENFKRDGFLAPILFFFKDNNPIIGMIPPELLNTDEGKERLASIIKGVCGKPNVLAAGLIMEANAAKIDSNSELAKLITNGDISISELKEKQDIIVLFFGTPESEEIIAYTVDCKNKIVGKPFGKGATNLRGKFSGFFSWNKN
jgi:hypothetical protein